MALDLGLVKKYVVPLKKKKHFINYLDKFRSDWQDLATDMGNGKSEGKAFA